MDDDDDDDIFTGDRSHESSRHLGSCLAPLGSTGPENRVSGAQRGGARSHHANPFTENERQVPAVTHRCR